jgi:hypothetical protein
MTRATASSTARCVAAAIGKNHELCLVSSASPNATPVASGQRRAALFEAAHVEQRDQRPQRDDGHVEAGEVGVMKVGRHEGERQGPHEGPEARLDERQVRAPERAHAPQVDERDRERAGDHGGEAVARALEGEELALDLQVLVRERKEALHERGVLVVHTKDPVDEGALERLGPVQA